MLSDLRHAIRLLFKSLGFTLIAVLTLTLGIGANSAIFSVINTVLLKPLPFAKPNELVMLWGRSPETGGRESQSFPDYVDFRDQSTTIRNLAAYTEAATVLGTGAEARQLQGVAVTSDIFAVLGVNPVERGVAVRARAHVEVRVGHVRGV